MSEMELSKGTISVRKFQIATFSRFGVIRKKMKTWTNLPEKTLNKNNYYLRAMGM